MPIIREDIVLQNNYGKDFNVVSTSSKEGSVKVLSQEKRGNRCIFKLQITPPELTGRGLYFRDVFTVKFDNGNEAAIQVTGYYKRDAMKNKKSS